MKCKDIYQRLLTIGIPAAYSHFTKPPSVPFCVYTVSDRRRYGADDLNLLESRTIRIELYSDSKDEALENRILSLFDDKEIDTYETWIDEEKLYQVVFEFDTVMKLTEE